jgi:hypothetical protein
MASPFVMSYTLLDSNGVKTSTPAYFVPTTPSTVTVANLITNWTNLGTALDDVTNGQIVGGRISIPVAPDGGWKSAPVEENDVSDVIVTNFNNGITRYAMEFIIPAFVEAILTGGKVDLTNTALVALISELTAAAVAGAFSNTAGQDLTSLRDAFQADRKHRRQLRNKSISTP